MAVCFNIVILRLYHVKPKPILDEFRKLYRLRNVFWICEVFFQININNDTDANLSFAKIRFLKFFELCSH